MSIYTFALQLKKKNQVLRMGIQPAPLGRKAQPYQLFSGCRSISSKDWELFGNSQSKRNEEMHTTNEGSQMRQETCDVRDRNEFHIDKL